MDKPTLDIRCPVCSGLRHPLDECENCKEAERVKALSAENQLLDLLNNLLKTLRSQSISKDRIQEVVDHIF